VYAHLDYIRGLPTKEADRLDSQNLRFRVQQSITFIITLSERFHEPNPCQVSAYIDYAQRLKTEDLEPVFDCKKKLLPRPSDLSFYNWETQTSTSNATPNFQVFCSLQWSPFHVALVHFVSRKGLWHNANWVWRPLCGCGSSASGVLECNRTKVQPSLHT
jgi:hypothetical protein